MNVSEIFHSIQGEGDLAGMPSTFIRLAHCNLTCSWCDAAYTWKGNVQYAEQTVNDVAAQVKHDHVVITGGEPTFTKEFDDLVDLLRLLGRHITVETNGTILREHSLAVVDLWSVSPKLGSSKQAAQLNMDVLREYVGWPSVQWKFVIDDELDFEAAVDLMHRLELGRHARVFMQPNGLCHTAEVVDFDSGPREKRVVTDTDAAGEPEDSYFSSGDAVYELRTPYLDRLRWLYELVVSADAGGYLPCPVRAVPQSHKLAWGNRRGF